MSVVPHRDSTRRARAIGLLGLVLAWGMWVCPCFAQEETGATSTKPTAAEPTTNPGEMLTSQQWSQLANTVDTGLEFLKSQQQRDGSFTAPDEAQPAVTSLCIMAFLSRGHVPGEGPYGEQLTRAIDYVLTTQNPQGLFCLLPVVGGAMRNNGCYNHAITGVMLGEVYGMTQGKQAARIRPAIEGALRYTLRDQKQRKLHPDDVGGWRYLDIGGSRSDLSVTAWQLMFLRSARNAEFEIPEQPIRDAMQYVRRCFDRKQKAFLYISRGYRTYVSRGMVGAGAVTLSLGGEHQSEIARLCGDWILNHKGLFAQYNGPGTHYEDRYHYSCFYCSQATFQLGGKYWKEFFPVLLTTLSANQHPNGSWDAEASPQEDARFGNTYTSAIAVLALTPPYQLLPIYQR